MVHIPSRLGAAGLAGVGRPVTAWDEALAAGRGLPFAVAQVPSLIR